MCEVRGNVEPAVGTQDIIVGALLCHKRMGRHMKLILGLRPAAEKQSLSALLPDLQHNTYVQLLHPMHRHRNLILKPRLAMQSLSPV